MLSLLIDFPKFLLELEFTREQLLECKGYGHYHLRQLLWVVAFVVGMQLCLSCGMCIVYAVTTMVFVIDMVNVVFTQKVFSCDAHPNLN